MLFFKKAPVAFAVFSAVSTFSLFPFNPAFADNLGSSEPSSTNLPKMIVTANNATQSLSSVTADTTVITAEEIAQHQYKTLADAIQQVSGLSNYSYGGLGSPTSLFMNGMAGKNILVLQNGMQLNDPTLTDGTTNFANILLSDVERIEIIKGPQSGVWGANASAGVINIITKKGDQKADINIEFGSNNQKKLAATLGAGNDKVDFTVNLSDLSTDGFTAIKKYKTSGSGDEKDGFNQQEASFNLGINLPQGQRLETYVKQSSGNSNSDSTYPTPDPNSSGSSTYESTLRQVQYLATVGNLNTKLYAQDSHITRTYPAYSSTYEGKVNQFGGQADWNYAAHQQASIGLVSKQLEDIQKANSYYNQALAMNNTNQFFNQKFTLTQALRYDEFNQFDNKTTGKIGGKFQFRPSVFISGNFGTGYNAPSLYQLSSLLTAGSNLKPESSTGYDATLGLFGLKLTYFNNEIQDELAYSYVSSTVSGYYNQNGTSKYEGIEALYKRAIEVIHTDFSVNFTQQTAKDKDGKWLARRPEQQGGVMVDFYGLPSTHLGLQTQYTGNLYDKANQKGANIGNYSVTNLVADYELNPHLTLYGKVQNLFNQDYTPAVAGYEADNVTPKYVYNNGGTLWFIGIRGKML